MPSPPPSVFRQFADAVKAVKAKNTTIIVYTRARSNPFSSSVIVVTTISHVVSSTSEVNQITSEVIFAPDRRPLRGCSFRSPAVRRLVGQALLTLRLFKFAPFEDATAHTKNSNDPFGFILKKLRRSFGGGEVLCTFAMMFLGKG